MKRILLFSALMLTYIACMSQVPNDRPIPYKSNGEKEQSKTVPEHKSQENSITGSRAYEIIVQKVESEDEVKSRNNGIRGLIQEQNSRGFFESALGKSLKSGYGSLASQKTVNLTSSLIDYSIGFVATAVKNHKERFNNWYKTANSYRQFSKTLSQQQTIGDFYALPSTNGAFDPENIAFKGIGCSSYFSSRTSEGQTSKHDEYCFIFCSLRTDSVGLRSIVNHSKFMLEIDSIYFKPNLCDIPCNISRKVLRETDFFEKQTDLNVSLKIQFYSSWFNEAIMLQRDQLLGSFDVVVKIDKSDCVMENGEWVFKYSKKKDGDSYMPSTEMGQKLEHLSEISISGESFIVPRSFSMDAKDNNSNPIWGTGEYRVDLTFSENCNLNTDYYYVEEYRQSSNSSKNNAKSVAFANLPEKKNFDKKIWQAEWIEMKKIKKAMPNGNDKSDTFLNGAWNKVISTMKGTSWTTTFFSPLISSLTDEEMKAINKILGLDSATSSGQVAKGQTTSQKPSTNNSMGSPNGTGGPDGSGNPNAGNGSEKPQNPAINM